MARSDAEVVSQLKVYSYKRSKDHPGWLVVTCPYEDCGDVFLVRGSRWLRPKKRVARTTGNEYTITGRSCPYCFRAGALPA